MSLLRKPFLVVAAYFIILRGMNTGETISSIIGSASERMRGDVWEADARLFAENTDYWQRHYNRGARVCFLLAVWLCVLTIAISIWAWVYQVPLR